MFARGDRVHFTGRNGKDVVGKVIKINSKTYVIAEDPAPDADDFTKRFPLEWRVSPGLLALEGEPLPERASQTPGVATLRVGDKGVVDAPDSPVWHGQEVTIIKVNPKRYKTRLPNNSILNIPFNMVKAL